MDSSTAGCIGEFAFESRRPTLVVRHAAVVCAQPLAARAGIGLYMARNIMSLMVNLKNLL